MNFNEHLRDGIGCWAENRTGGSADFRGKPALFLDRDGVVIEEKNYLADPQQVSLLTDVAPLIAAVNAMGYPVVVVTNQSGIARGVFGWTEFASVMHRMHSDLAERGATINFVYACGFHDSADGPLGVADHPWRKPNPGMLLAAAADTGCDMTRSIIIGDKAADLVAGRAAGVGAGVLLAQGYGANADEQRRSRELQNATFRVDVVERLSVEALHDFR